MTFATNTFVNVPVILKYDDPPLVEVVQTVDVGYSTQFTIYDDSGVKLAVVTGTQIYATKAGRTANLELLHPQGKTVGQRGGQTLFEIERIGAAALKAAAELYAPDGRFVVAQHDVLPTVLDRSTPLEIRGTPIQGNYFDGVAVGVHLRGDGSIGIGGMG